MKFLFSSLLAGLALQVTQTYAADWTNESPEPITPVPPPWALKATVYAFPFVPLGPLPTKAYSPLERTGRTTEGSYVGGVGAIMIIRYSDTPVGPYDELAIVPGFFSYTQKLSGGGTKLRLDVRGTRFYVSQKYTNWNGRISTCFFPSARRAHPA